MAEVGQPAARLRLAPALVGVFHDDRSKTGAPKPPRIYSWVFVFPVVACVAVLAGGWWTAPLPVLVFGPVPLLALLPPLWFRVMDRHVARQTGRLVMA